MSMSPGGGDAVPERAYHHGDLREAIIQASFELLAESGSTGFSVAAVARRLSVSSAAPYRHFRDRRTLLAAIGTSAALDLAEQMRREADQAGPDPVDRFAVTAGTYVRFAAERGAGFNVIFAAGPERLQDEDLAQAGRALVSLLLELSEEAAGLDRPGSLLLLEHHIANAHGYATLHRDGFFARQNSTAEDIAARAVRASRDLIRAALAANRPGER